MVVIFHLCYNILLRIDFEISIIPFYIKFEKKVEVNIVKEKIVLASPHMGGKEEEYVKEAFETNWIAPLGPQVDKFEKEISKYSGKKYAAALSSGTAAIHLALITLGVEKGDKVFCSDLTFAASCNPIVYQGATPIFIDSERDSFNMSPIALEKAFKEHKPKAVIVVHLYGQSADMDKIKEICDREGVPIIEDAAESLGATYKDKMSGTIGRLGIYSFNGNKIITTSGGGVLISDEEDIIKKARFLATQARENERYYEHKELGFNYRMSNVSAAIGRGQLEILEKRVAQKKNIYETYKEGFKHIEEISMAPICDYGKPNYWLSVMVIDRKSSVTPLDVILALEEENIESRHIWKPMHMQPFFKEYPFYSHEEGEMSVGEDIFNRGLCLPSDTKMSEEDMQRVIKTIKNYFKYKG